MIFDADVHLSLTEPNGLSAETVLRMMDRAGIDRANIWLQPPYMRMIDEANRYVYDSARAHPDRFVPSGWTDPHFGMDAAMDMTKRCVEEYGMQAVKMNGAQNSFYIDDERLFPIHDYLQRMRCGLSLHIGADFFEYTHPMRARTIAKKFPALRLLMVHMGGAGIPNLSKACIEVAQECPNMLLVGSAVSYLSIVEAIRTLGPARVCFGSDAPFAMMHVERAAYEAFLPDVTDAEGIKKIMGENIAGFMRAI